MTGIIFGNTLGSFYDTQMCRGTLVEKPWSMTSITDRESVFSNFPFFHQKVFVTLIYDFARLQIGSGFSDTLFTFALGVVFIITLNEGKLQKEICYNVQ